MASRQPKTLPFTPLILLNATLLILVSSNSDTVSHYSDFVYKKCRNETRIPQNLVSTLLQELVEESSKSKFYQTNTGDDIFAVSGAFQCRRDLTHDNCHDCVVKTLPRLLCGSGFLARVQLKGCYVSLETEPEPKLDPKGGRIDNRVLIGVQKDYVQHKKCGDRSVLFEGLEEVRDVAFELVAKCVTSSGDGHCDTSRGGLYAMAQCDGSLGECGCGECLSNAFQVVQDECWGSESGEVYLENCFVSFSNNEPNHDGGTPYQENVGGGSTKVVAMVVGVGIALVLLSALCYGIRSAGRKHDG